MPCGAAGAAPHGFIDVSACRCVRCGARRSAPRLTTEHRRRDPRERTGTSPEVGVRPSRSLLRCLPRLGTPPEDVIGRIEIDRGRTLTGKRDRYYETVTGSKKQAQARDRELRRLLDTGVDIEPSKLTVEEWLDQWIRNYAQPWR